MYCCCRLTLAILKFVVFKRLELNGYRCWTWRKCSANQKDKLMQLLIIYYKHKKSQYFLSVQVRSNSKLPFRFTLLRFSSVVNLTPSFSSKNSYIFSLRWRTVVNCDLYVAISNMLHAFHSCTVALFYLISWRCSPYIIEFLICLDTKV